MIAGKYYRDLAWHFRGAGTVNTVSQDGWRKFGQYLPLAAKYFTRAWQLRPQWPEAPAEMVGVSGAGGDERHTPRGWFDRAVRAAMDSAPAYDYYEISLRPRWGGSNRDLIRFGEECLATERFDTRVPHRLYAILVGIDRAPDGDSDVWELPGVYDNLHRMFDGYAESDTMSVAGDRQFRSCHAYVAARMERFSDAREAFDELGDDVQWPKLVPTGVQFKRSRGRVYALTGPAAEPARQLHERRVESSFLDLESVEELQTLVAQARGLDTNPLANRYFEEMELLLKWRAQFLQGKWVELTFPDGLLGWDVLGAEPVVENASAVRLSTYHCGGGMRLQPRLWFEPPYVVELDVHEMSPQVLPPLGIRVGNLDRFDSPGRLFWADRRTGEVGRLQLSTHPIGTQMQLKEVNRLRAKIWQGHWETSVNGLPILQESDPSFHSDGSLSFGELTGYGVKGEARFSNIRIRALDYGPRPPAGENDARVAYCRDAIRFDPDDVPAHLWLSDTQLQLNRFEEQRDSLEKAKSLLDECYWSRSGLRLLLGMHEQGVGHFSEAIQHYERTIVDGWPHHAAYQRLAWLLATCPDDALRDGQRAVEVAERHATDGEEVDWWHRSVIAAAYAEIGQFERAVELQQLALKETTEPNRSMAELRLDLYKQGKPYRLSVD